MRSLALPTDRLLLGVGLGTGPEPLAHVRAPASTGSDAGDLTVLVGTLGPKMTTLAGEVADGVLFNWMTPDYADTMGRSATNMHRTAHTALHVAYVRCGLSAAADDRMKEEVARYGSIPSYGRHLERMGVTGIETCVVGADHGAIDAGLARFEAVLDGSITSDQRQRRVERRRPASRTAASLPRRRRLGRVPHADRCRVPADGARRRRRRRARPTAQRVEELGFAHVLAYDHVLGADPEVHATVDRPLRRAHHVPRAVRAVRLPGRAHVARAGHRHHHPAAAPDGAGRQAGGRGRPAHRAAGSGSASGIGWNAVEYEALGKTSPTAAGGWTSRSRCCAGCGPSGR